MAVGMAAMIVATLKGRWVGSVLKAARFRQRQTNGVFADGIGGTAIVTGG